MLSALYRADGDDANLSMPRSGDSPWPDGAQSEFTLITWVVNAEGMQYLYVDGDPVPVAWTDGSGVINGDWSSGTNSAFLGAMCAINGDDPYAAIQNTWVGQIAEFIIYDGALITVDRQAIEGYLLDYVPEPATLGLLLIGGVMALVHRRCR